MSLSRPMASASTTCPKHPSPRGLPRMSLAGGERDPEAGDGGRRLVAGVGKQHRQRRRPHPAPARLLRQRGPTPGGDGTSPVPRQLPPRVLGELVLGDAGQHGGAAGGEPRGPDQHHARVHGGAGVGRHLQRGLWVTFTQRRLPPPRGLMPTGCPRAPTRGPLPLLPPSAACRRGVPSTLLPRWTQTK